MPNAFGLHDLHGGLAEWCQDVFDAKWYETTPPNDPQGPVEGTMHVIRGGFRRDIAPVCRSASRFSFPSSMRTFAVGFRVVRVLDASTTTASAVLPTTDPAFQQWMKKVAVMPAEKQIEVVSKKLLELNPKFDRKLRDFDLDSTAPLIERGVVTSISLAIENVSDVSPLCAFVRLTALDFCRGDLTDLSPLKGMPLTKLAIHFTRVSDLSPLQGMKFTVLRFAGTKVTDISLIREMPLKDLNCNFQPERDTELLKSIKTLEMINVKPVAQFWKEVEEQQKGKKIDQ